MLFGVKVNRCAKSREIFVKMVELLEKVEKIQWQCAFQCLDHHLLNLEDEIHLKGGRIVTP